MGYSTWSTARDIPLFVTMVNPTDGTALTGQTPEVAVRRRSDGLYWNGSIGTPAFGASPTWVAVAEVSAGNVPGLYAGTFPNALLGVEETYEAYYRITSGAAAGYYDVELHYVSDELAAAARAGGGTGSNLVTLTIEDDLAAPIANTQVDVYDSTNTVFVSSQTTGVAGTAVFSLNDGSYRVRLSRSGYSFTVPEVLTVAADPTTATFEGTSSVAVSAPSAPSLCVVFGTLRDVGGNVHAGSCIEFTSVTPQVVSGAQHSNRLQSVVTDSNGYFEIELERGSVVAVVSEDADIETELTVPDLALQDFTSWS